jgi:hypothetical protein
MEADESEAIDGINETGKSKEHDAQTGIHSETGVRRERNDRQQTREGIQCIERNDHERHSSSEADRISDTGVVNDNGRRNVSGTVRTAEIPAEVIAEYTCCICGITLRDCSHWGGKCRKTYRRVCANCCYKCEHHVSWSGIWRCGYTPPEQKRDDVQRRIRERFEEEERKASEAFNKKRREEAKLRAIKRAKAAKRAKQNPGGKY